MTNAGRSALAGLLALIAGAAFSACGGTNPQAIVPERMPSTVAPDGTASDVAPTPTRRTGVVTLAFAGDMHFQLNLAALLDHPRGALGPMARTLAAADLAMANLETSITDRGRRLHSDYAFRTSPAALDVLAGGGIDVVTMANNHAVDYGPVGLKDTLRAVRTSPIPVVGIGRNQREALSPHRVTIRGTSIAIFAASAEPDQLARSAAGPHKAGIAAFDARPGALLEAVRAATGHGDVVVVYLHWGTEGERCPTREQGPLAQALVAAGADVIVGSHAHVLLGSGWMGDSYVNYGLGNFLWYHNHEPASGVLQLRVRDGVVISDSWAPAQIQTLGRPRPLHGKARTAAIADWRRLRGCTDLSAGPPR
jgi:poly-gamma-glutamate capsule biosynthesis protein CapA/YwtB (metallophosphatase superfamily)